MSDDIVKKYIERVEKLRQKNQSKITREDLESIARDVGLSDADLAAVDEHVQAHYERGDGYVTHGLWDDAIAEFEEAFALAPTRVHVVYALANAYYGRAQAADSEEDRQRALEFAKECLELDSQYQPAFTLQSQIRSLDVTTQQPSSSAPPQVQKASGSGLIVTAIAAMLVLMGAGVAGFVMMTGADESPSQALKAHPPAVKTPLTETTANSEETTSAPIDDPPFRLGETTGKTIEVVPTPEGAGLVLHVTKSEHSVYDDKAYFGVQALLKNEGSREFDEIKGELVLTAADGSALRTQMARLHESHDATLRPGDWSPYSTTISAPREFEKAVLKVVEIDARRALEYPEAKVIEPVLASQMPSGIELDIRERSSRMTSGGYFQAEWGIKNTGKTYISDLRLECVAYDSDDDILGRRDWLVVYSGTAKMAPGQLWPESTIQEVDGEVARYDLRILEIR